MADLKIPKLNKNSDKFFFKKKLSLRRKSKSKLRKEAFFMFSFGLLIIYLNYLIPNKTTILNNFFYNFGKLIGFLLDSISYVYEICLAIFIIVSLFISLILIVGTFSRILRVAKRNTGRINIK